ncbi:MAG: long-chain fatty acid--CoA ligase [bacterium]
MINDFKTIPEMFYRVCDKFSGRTRPAFYYKSNGSFISLTHNELNDKVEKLALALLELGIQKGDRVGIISENRIEWIISSFAISIIGAVNVPIFPVLTAKQAKFVFEESDVSAVFCSDKNQLLKIESIYDDVSSLRHIIVMDNVSDGDLLSLKTFDELILRGSEIRDEKDRKAILRRRINKISEDDILTIIYTSGTTGNPKGVMLTHKNVCINIVEAMLVFGDHSKATSLSFLPLCHSFEMTGGFYGLFSHGCVIALAGSVSSVAADMQIIKPTVMTVVPRLLETVRKKILGNIERENTLKRTLILSALETGIKYAKAQSDGTLTLSLKYKNLLAYNGILNRIKDKLGGNIEKFISGGAPLSDEVCYFFMALGIDVFQGYGLTEASPVLSSNGFAHNEIGTIGKPLNSVEIKIAEDGEILARGPNIMKGYWKDPVATLQAIDDDGWLYTGDIGLFTEKGSIKITDRKKNIFVNTGGKNIAPQPIENLLTSSRYIEHCFLIGDKRDYCTALLTPDYEQLKEMAKEFNINYTSETELISHPKIIQFIKKEIDWYQKDIAPFEKVRKFHLLSTQFSIDGGELSPKLSIKRHVVERKYSTFIDNMYGVNNESD